MMDFRKTAAMIAAAMAVSMCAQVAAAHDSSHKRHHSSSHKNWHSRSSNFYSNWDSVLRLRGIGTYVVGSSVSARNPDLYIVRAPSAGVKIIDVKSERNACSYENGVCVIRGTD